MQLPLVGARRTEAEAQMEALAARCGGSIRGRVFCEVGSPVTALWSLLAALDECSGPGIIEGLHEIAAREGVDVSRLLTAPPPTPAFTSMLDALSQWGGVYVIAPSPRHFDGLGYPRNVVLQRILRTDPEVSVEYVHPISIPLVVPPKRDTETLAHEGDEDLDEDRPVELGVEQVDAYGLALEVIRLSAHRYLTRAGLGDLVEQVDALLTEVVNAAIRFTTRTNQAPQANRLTVRWLRYPVRLIVMVEETRDHADEPISVALQNLCDRQHVAEVSRDRGEDGGTVTWFDLPLPRYRLPGDEPRPRCSGRSARSRS
ncbi:hypothetical protein FG87_31180 [Nocardia vulneris]|uniref:Uncharacterized protein n=2 Tax=Nocardia vulneris TaxID=1141657 RepID=A0ABR4Z7V2_9NOCA|nr:hypothetical protein FG87_31180 [Nocardia vulneris]